MLQARIQQFRDSLRQGTNAGFAAGLVVLFLILIGIPIKLGGIALFALLLVMAIFGVRLARRLNAQPVGYLLKNAVAMGITAALIVGLFLALVNRWQTRGIDTKQYFDAITIEAMSALSGVPEAELHPNPDRDPLTDEYPEGEELRTSPMRLSFDEDTGLILKLGFKLNLVIGGIYGFLLLLIVSGVLGAVIVRGAAYAKLGQYRKQAAGSVSGNPLSRWGVLLLPLLAFVLQWLTVPQRGDDAIFSLGSSAQDIQMLIGFGIILFGLVAVRAAQPTDWGLNYPVRLGICGVMILALVLVGLWRILGDEVYFIPGGDENSGNRVLSAITLIGVGGLLAFQNMRSLRRPGRFEQQFAGTLAFLVLMLMPLYLNQGQLDVMLAVGINVMMGVGLNIIIGYTGLLNLGYVAFFALGAYAYAFISSNQQEIGPDNQPVGLKFAWNDDAVTRMGGWMVITVVVTVIVVTAGISWWRRRQSTRPTPVAARPTLISLPSRPTAGISVLLVLIAITSSMIVVSLVDGTGLYQEIFGSISPFVVGIVVGVLVSALAGLALGIPVLGLRGDYLAIVTLGFAEIIRLLFNNLRDFTGGPQGVLKIPRPVPSGSDALVTYLWMVYLVLIGVGLVAFFSLRLKQGRIGRAWNAMRTDEDIAQSMGINLVQTKLMAFALGTAFAGVGGVMFAARQQNIFPADFSLNVSIEVLSLVIIGGMGSIPGVIIGAIALIGVPEMLRELESYRYLVFGALLVVMVIIRPEGLLPAPPPQLRERARLLTHQDADREEEQQ